MQATVTIVERRLDLLASPVVDEFEIEDEASSFMS